MVFTGLSGSGKSSLAFDTIHAEGQRRYVESLSAYARQFLGQMDKPDVDFIEGLSPAISIDQKSSSRNPRSTVGTVTEVYDYLRLLYARIGKPHCPTCGRPVARAEPPADRGSHPGPGRGHPLSGPGSGGPGPEGRVRRPPRRPGQAGLRPGPGRRGDGGAGRAGQLDLARYEQHTIEVVVDRLVRRDDIRRRLTESLETALSLAEGVAEVVVVDADGTEEEAITFSQHLACTHCGLSFEDPSPRNFSFNSPYGACPACTWSGTRSRSTRSWWCPTRPSPSPKGLLAPGPGPAASTSPGWWPRWPSCRVLRRRPVGEAEEGRQEAGALRSRRPSGPPQVPQPLRAPAVVRHRLRGHRPVAPASPLRGRLRIPPGQPRELPPRGALPRVWRARRRPQSLAVTVGGYNIFELCSLSIGTAVDVVGSLDLSDRGPSHRRPWSSARCGSGCNSLLDVGL